MAIKSSRADQLVSAKNIGLSVRWACGQRTRYGRITRGEEKVPRTKREHQNRAIAMLEQEAQILDEVLVGSAQDRAVVAPPLKEKIEERLGKRVVLSIIHRMLVSHGWCKLAPDRTHPQGNAALREDWRKN